MATPATVNPFNFYPGRDGLPLQNGYLYFGEPFQDPELQPLQAYWDDANTQPAARPIRTINGYPARNGTPAQVFVAAQYSMRVRDSQGREVFYAPNVTAVDLGGGGLDIITASGGQTVVNLTNAAYTPGSNAIDVSLNGLILISGQDYFETGTTRITMASALSAGDQIRAFARSTFGLTQAVLSDWQAEVFDGDGTASQNFTLTRNPGAVANMDISVTIGGIGSTLRPLIDYTLSGQTVTITPAPAVGTDNVLIRYGRSLPQDALRGELASTASAADGAGLSGINQTLNYVAGTIGHILNDVCHDPRAFPWLAKFDGATDDTAAIAACIAATANGTVLLPANAAKVAATIPVGVTCRIQGVSSNAVISTSHATNDVFQVSASGVVFENFQITASVTRTGGYFINFNGSANANNYSRVSGMTLTQWFNGIGITGGGSTTYHLYDLIMSTSIVAGIGIVQSTTANAVDVIGRDILILGPTSGAQLTAGIQIQNSGDTTLCRVSTVKCGIGLNLVPQNGQRIQALIVSDSYFDSGDGAGVQANPAAGATIDLLKMSNTWVCTNVNGVSLGPSGTGLIQCVELFNCTMSNHAAGTGLTSTSVVTNLRVVGGSASANVNGVSIGANQNEFSIIGLRAGPCGEFAGNSSTGIVVAAGTSTNYLIMGCDLRGNTSAALTDGGTGTTKYTFANLGVNPGTTVPVTVGASPFTHTAGASPITAYVAGGTVSNITVAGQSTGLASGTFRVGPRQALVITYTVAPTLVVTTD